MVISRPLGRMRLHILKPALARGTIRVIGAMERWSDGAMERRVQAVNQDRGIEREGSSGPSVGTAVAMGSASWSGVGRNVTAGDGGMVDFQIKSHNTR